MLDYVVDRLLHTAATSPPYAVRPEVAELHRQVPVVDLLVGSPLFRREFVTRQRRGHVDLPRLRASGVNLVGISLATRFPDLRGTLSAPHFLALGVPPAALRGGMAIVETLVARVEAWERQSDGRLRIVRTTADLDAVLEPGGPVGAFLGVQGAHAFDGDPTNLERLHALGVRMLAPAHVMDNAYVGSGTGRHAGGLTGAGRDLLAEQERLGLLVDLAHMSSAGIRDAVPLLTRPFVLSHTGFVERCGRRGWRRYSPASRNLSSADARLVADAGGVVGVTYATELLGGESVTDLVDTIRFAVDLLGAEHVALGSDLDGALRATFEIRGVPLITQGLLDAALSEGDVALVLGGNALRVLRTSLAAG